MFWTPAFAGVATKETFYDSVNIGNFGFRICLGFGYWLLEFRLITVSPDWQNLSGCSTKSGGFSEN